MGMITRGAGTGTGGYSGDDGPATGAELNLPAGVAVAADGGFLIADTANNLVRKVSAAGVITRVAGTGTAGYSGDDGPATGAELNLPAGVAVAADGGFLIADTDNNMVRKVAGVGPTVTGVSPTSGSEAGGNTVTVTGTGFTNAIGVTFGTAAASALVVASDITLTVTSPPNPMGTVDVTVTTPAGTSAATAADQFTYI